MPWEVTANYIRSGHRNPDEFEPESLRTIVLSEAEGVKAIIGKPRGGEGSTEVVSFLFDVSKGWTLGKPLPVGLFLRLFIWSMWLLLMLLTRS